MAEAFCAPHPGLIEQIKRMSAGIKEALMSQCHEETGGTWARGSLEDQISEANLRSGSRPGEVSAPLGASRFYLRRPVAVFFSNPQKHLDLQDNPYLIRVKSQGSLLLCCFHKKKKLPTC